MRLRSFKIFWAASLLAALSSCAGLRPILDPDTNYKRDLKVEVEVWDGKKFKDKIKFKGFGLVEQAEKYKITVYAEGKVDALTFTSCHREVTDFKPDKSWWTKGVSFEFEPVKNLETNINCPLDIGIYEKKKGRHGWALLEFLDDRMKLSAKVKCNGSDEDFNGVSICQAKAGLMQEISFKEDVDFEAIAGCEIARPVDKRNHRYIMPSGDCTVHFCSYFDSSRCHKHTIYGYQIIPVRGVE